MFPLASPVGQRFHLSSEIFQHLVDPLPKKGCTDIDGARRCNNLILTVLCRFTSLNLTISLVYEKIPAKLMTFPSASALLCI